MGTIGSKIEPNTLAASRAKDNQRRAEQNEKHRIRQQRGMQRDWRRARRSGDIQMMSYLDQRMAKEGLSTLGGGIPDSDQTNAMARDRALNRADQLGQIREPGFNPVGGGEANNIEKLADANRNAREAASGETNNEIVARETEEIADPESPETRNPLGRGNVAQGPNPLGKGNVAQGPRPFGKEKLPENEVLLNIRDDVNFDPLGPPSKGDESWTPIGAEVDQNAEIKAQVADTEEMEESSVDDSRATEEASRQAEIENIYRELSERSERRIGKAVENKQKERAQSERAAAIAASKEERDARVDDPMSSDKFDRGEKEGALIEGKMDHAFSQLGTPFRGIRDFAVNHLGANEAEFIFDDNLAIKANKTLRPVAKLASEVINALDPFSDKGLAQKISEIGDPSAAVEADWGKSLGERVAKVNETHARNTQIRQANIAAQEREKENLERLTPYRRANEILQP